MMQYKLQGGERILTIGVEIKYVGVYIFVEFSVHDRYFWRKFQLCFSIQAIFQHQP